MAPYPVRDVTGWDVVNTETIGRDRKVWLREPDVPDERSRERDWLFKPVIIPDHGVPQGEDWAEKIVSELGALLGVPCARVDLAERHGLAGSLSRNVAPDGWTLVLGSVLLGSVLGDYQEGERKVPGRPGHSVETIRTALSLCESPEDGELSAGEMFAGYLTLDAWVSNQDRHDQNWAVLRRTTEPWELKLAPSYDHASSLGSNLLDAKRAYMRNPQALLRWLERGRAHRFEHDPTRPRSEIPSLVATARRAWHLAGPRARMHWTDRLRTIDPDAVRDVVERTPRLSVLGATVVVDMLEVNRGRLLRDD